MEEHVFSNFAELSDIAASLDTCRREDSKYFNPVLGQMVPDAKRRDIINLKTGNRAAVVSNIYHEYQHADVIDEIAQSMAHAKIEGHGSVYDSGDRIACAVFFDNITALRDPTSEKGIKLGAMFKNSYNKQNSVTGSGYFTRIECLNQMYFGNLIQELKFSERHTGSILQALPQSIAEFTDNLLMRSNLVAESIQRAVEVEIVFTNREQRLQTMQSLIDHAKWGEKVEEQLKTLNPTKWDVYNAITAVTSHERMADGVKDRLEKLSEKVLAPTYTVIPAVLVHA